MGLSYMFRGNQKVCEECGRPEEELDEDEKMIIKEDYILCSECWSPQNIISIEESQKETKKFLKKLKKHSQTHRRRKRDEI